MGFLSSARQNTICWKRLWTNQWPLTFRTKGTEDILNISCKQYRPSWIHDWWQLNAARRGSRGERKVTWGWRSGMVPCSGTCRLFLCKACRHVEKWNPWIDDLGTGWKLVVSFMPRPICPRDKSPDNRYNAVVYMKSGGQLTFLLLSTYCSYGFIHLRESVEKNNTLSTECMSWLLVEIFTK